MPTRTDIDITEVTNWHFEKGLSVLAIAKRLNCSRGCVVHHLHKAGLRQRNRHESALVVWKNRSAKSRAAQVHAAHTALRGTSSTPTALANRAAAKAGKTQSALEDFVLCQIRNLQVTAEPGYPLEGYLIDIVLPDYGIAIEVDGGNWHQSKAKKRHDEAKEKLLRRDGWRLLRVNSDTISAVPDLLWQYGVPVK